MEQRPNPEELLKRIQEEERQELRGKLKIYLGAAPGVGKTCTMLQDALAKRSEGLDVVIGIVESHGRIEIEALIKKFEILPREQFEYRGKQLTEFNLDAAIKRNPALILIDEMAHTNVPGARHNKRWQDIKEILDCGIDVYTTLNVQHIETLNDIVSRIIKVRIKETVPDDLIEIADTIELVDLPPEDLLKRLKEGKVYFPEQAELAKENFFRKGNLIALRELALRFTADRVEAQVILHRQGEGIKRIWPLKEKILVCVGHRSDSLKLIRAARRIATKLQAEWIAIHIDTTSLRLSENQHNIALQNLRFAERLGAETHILTGFDIVKEIMDFARKQNVSQIMLWKHVRPRWREFFFKSLADEIVRSSEEIDVYIVTPSKTDVEAEIQPQQTQMPTKQFPWRIYGISLGILAAATFIDYLLHPHLATSNLIMVYLLGVTLVAMFGQLGPSILASVLSVLAYYYFFVPSDVSFSLSGIQYFFTLIVMLLVTQIISHLTILTRKQAKAAQLAEQHTADLNKLSRQLASARGVDKLLGIAVHYIGELLESETVALLPEDDHLTIRASYHSTQTLSVKEQGVALWVYNLGQNAGLGTDTLAFSEALYVPLLTSRGTIGVLRVRPLKSKNLFTPEQISLLESCSNQLALALEADRLEEQTKNSELRTEIDRVRSALLRSVSHDLRTPLISAMGTTSTLMAMAKELDPNKIKKLGKEIYFELEQLSRLINNLLQITYLESEAVKLKTEFHSIKDLITLVINNSSRKLEKKQVHIHLQENLPKIPFDNVLIQEVLNNLIDNAVKFTPINAAITISAVLEQDKIVISVADSGPGIVTDEVNHLFEKFYRGRMLTTERGLGLGLAICRSIVEAHNGEIWAENHPEGGAVFCFTLPLSAN